MENRINTLYQDIAEYKNDASTTALYFRKEKISFHDFISRIDTMAYLLAEKGIRKDSVVSLLSPNVPEAIITFYALNKLGAITLVIHPLIPIKSLEDSLLSTKCEYSILLDSRYEDYQEELKLCNQKVFFISALPDLGFFEKAAYKKQYRSSLSLVPSSQVLCSLEKIKQKNIQTETNTDPNKISLYLRTGGTTGRNKMVVFNDAAVRYAGTQAEYIIGRKLEGLSMIGLLPLFHGFGLSMGIHAPLMHHGSVYLMSHFDPDEIASAINRNQLHLLLAVPYMIDKLLQSRKFRNADLSKLYMTFVGADRCPASLREEFDDLMKKHSSENRIYEGYGLTEIVTVGVVNTKKDYREGSVGKPLPGIFVKIVSPEDRRIEMPLGQDGEILITGQENCLGYLNLDKRHQPFFTDSRHITYVSTGDIGHLDKDGFLFFKNRSNDIIKIAGYNVYPTDIESLAIQVDGVVDACAIYVDEVEKPYIHLYLEKHTKDDEKLSEEVMKHLKENLIKYSLPRTITCLPHFPRTALGKIDRKALIHF